MSWRLRGTSFRVAVGVAALLGAAVLAAAAYDYASALERRPVPLELVTLAGKVVAAAGLAAVAGRTRSFSMWLLAGLAGLLAVASLLADSEIADEVVDTVAEPLTALLPLSGGVVHNGLFFGTLGLAALGLLLAAWLKARPGERQVVGALVVLFALAGVFIGPVNAIAGAGISREWLFAEDFGQAVLLAALAGYVSGLVFATADHPNSPARTNTGNRRRT